MQNRAFLFTHGQEQGKQAGDSARRPEWGLDDRTWPIQVTFGEEGSDWVSTDDEFLLRMNIGLERDLPLLLATVLVLRNLIISGGGGFSVLLGLDVGCFVIIFISLSLSLSVGSSSLRRYNFSLLCLSVCVVSLGCLAVGLRFGVIGKILHEKLFGGL